jgi:hypothetical protein
LKSLDSPFAGQEPTKTAYVQDAWLIRMHSWQSQPHNARYRHFNWLGLFDLVHAVRQDET